MPWDVYTDGSYCNQDGTSGYGVFCRTLDLCACGEGRRVRSSTRAESYAVEKALELVLAFDQKYNTVRYLNIMTDLSAIIDGVDSWRRGYPCPQFVSITNLLTKCSNEGIIVKFYKVRAHSGVAGNEIADTLATYGRYRMSQTNRYNFAETVEKLADARGVQYHWIKPRYVPPPVPAISDTKVKAASPCIQPSLAGNMPPTPPISPCEPNNKPLEDPVPSELVERLPTPVDDTTASIQVEELPDEEQPPNLIENMPPTPPISPCEITESEDKSTEPTTSEPAPRLESLATIDTEISIVQSEGTQEQPSSGTAASDVPGGGETSASLGGVLLIAPEYPGQRTTLKFTQHKGSIGIRPSFVCSLGSIFSFLFE